MTRTTRAAIRRSIQAALVIGLFLAIFLAPSCVPRRTITRVPSEVAESSGELRPVRVLLAEGIASASVSIATPYTVEPWGKPFPGAPPILAQCPPLTNGPVRANAAALIVGDRHFPDDAVFLRIQGRAALTVNGRRYRGSLAVRRTGEGQFSLLNVLPIEDYLYGVLGGETYPTWPAAALEAQAIVARSYAMWRMAQRRDGPFDLYATVMDQNYLGMAKEDPRLTAAVDRTAGMVLLYQHQLFRCYYHSTCGGHTEDVQEVFPDPPLLPLSGVPCPYCKDSKHYSWTKLIPKDHKLFPWAEVIARLEHEGEFYVDEKGKQRLTEIAVSARTATGRAKEIKLSLSGERTLAVPASEFRVTVGAAKLPSTFFDLRPTASGYEFRGRGFGHGVGMCQWGSRGMAEAGFSAREILRHYYTGAQLTRLYDRRGR